MITQEQALEEARSWSNFWTGLAVSAAAISVLPAAFALAGMGLPDFAALDLFGYSKLIGPIVIGVLLGRALQTQAIITLRRAAQHPALQRRT